MQTKTSPVRVRTAERKQQAMAMRVAGATFEQIGNALGITRQATHALVTKELDTLAKETTENAEHLRAIELQRLDHLLAALWPSSMTGNVRAIDSCLRISERRSKLCGLDGAVKVEQQTYTVVVPDDWPVSEEETEAALARCRALASETMRN